MGEDRVESQADTYVNNLKLVVDSQPLPLASQDLREEHVEVVEIETGDTEEHGNLIRGSFPEGILSADSLSTDLIPTAFTDPAPL